MALTDKLKAIGDAIREKTGGTAKLSLDAMPPAIRGIKSNPVLQSKTVTPSTSKQTVTPDSGYDGLSSVTVNAMASGAMSDISVSSSGVITSQIGTSGYLASGTKKTKSLTTQAAKTVTPTKSSQTAVASGRYTTGAVTVAAIPSDYIVPSGTLNIAQNGTHDVTAYKNVTVNVESSGGGGGGETKWATGTISIAGGTKPTGTTIAEVTGLGFEPTYVIVFLNGKILSMNNTNYYGLALVQTGVAADNVYVKMASSTSTYVYPSAVLGTYANIVTTSDGFVLRSANSNIYTGTSYGYVAIYDSSYVAGGDDGGDDGGKEEEIPDL